MRNRVIGLTGSYTVGKCLRFHDYSNEHSRECEREQIWTCREK